MIITAIFTGTNSLGYENGKEYQLKVKYGSLSPILITRLDDSGLCFYQSLEAFLKNWNYVRVKH